jgi:hypothetical protein
MSVAASAVTRNTTHIQPPSERRGAKAMGSSAGIRLAAEAGMEGREFKGGAKDNELEEPILFVQTGN